MIVFISGIGTDVGKSFVNMQLNALLMECGYNIISIKPIETGISDMVSYFPPPLRRGIKGAGKETQLKMKTTHPLTPSAREGESESSLRGESLDSPKQSITDAQLHAQNQSAPKKIDEICFYRFALPAAPFVADSQGIIDIDFLKNKIKALEKECDILLVEGAGGLFVPIKKDYFFIDLINDLGRESGESSNSNTQDSPKPKLLCLLISHDKLGCIDAILSHREALERRNIEFISIVNVFNESQFRQISYPFLRDLKRNFIFQHQKREILEFILHFMKS